MPTEHVRILLIEDDPADARLIRELLSESKEMTFEVEGAETLAEGVARLAALRPDVVMLDLGLPDSIGLDTVRKLYAQAAGRLPVLIVLSIVIDQDLAVQAVQLGAQDYLIKGVVDSGGLVRSIRYARERRRSELALLKAQAELETRVRERTSELARANAELRAEVAERKQAEEALRASQRLLQGIVDNSGAVIHVKDTEGRYLLVNQRFEDLFHVTRDDVRGQTDFSIFPKERAEALRAEDARVREANEVLQAEELLPQDDGVHTYLSVRFPLHDAGGRTFATCVIATDISERKRLEEQLMQSQKLESIGRLAGGVAHDFNNILTAILGYGEIVTRELPADNPLVEDVEEIKLAAERAGRLTRQLLIFARRGVVEPRMLDLSELTLNLSHLLRRLIGEHVELVVNAAPKLWPIRADAGQVEQVLVNLAVNARDAMPRGGRLAITTENVVIGPEVAHDHPGLPPAPYIRLTISDTGSGMTPETRAHLFEPFFTTKGLGRGNGLGLATSHGIVQQCGGSIFCSSQLGQGTTFTIYLPRYEGRAQGLEVTEETPVPGGHETVLVVEDDSSVREIAVRALRARGYQVVEAANGVEALSLAERLGHRIDLLVTDMVMPQMGGLDLAEKLRANRPRLRALFTSGYTEDSNSQLRGIEDARFLQKPFTGSALARRVREVLGQG
jgi:two-component system, cell cycle sensor histidine kinase and response regulator CckA